MAWLGGLGGFLLPAWALAVALAACAGALVARRRRGGSTVLGLAWVLAAAAVAGAAMLRVEAVTHSRTAELAEQRAYITATVEVTTDPRRREGEYEPFVIVRARMLEVAGRGSTSPGEVPVLLIADTSWERVELGSVVQVSGRAEPADGSDLAAVISTSRPPVVRTTPGGLLDGAAAVRSGIRQAVADAGPAERTLVPALVVGDDQGMPAEVVADFRTSGLTHLLAVSGTNLTLVVGFMLILARGIGVRGRGLMVVGVLGVLGFVLLARTEPSVVRAAAMGSVALVGMGAGGRERGVRALGVAVWILLLLDPWLALSIGFALSALATAGILFLAPPCRDALGRWMPRWLAEAIAVPLAAQVTCTPLVAAISGQVSLVAVAANMLVAAAVGPATVLGLAGGFAFLVVEPVGQLLGRVAGWCAWWIVSVAERSADLPTAAVAWSSGVASVTVLALLCVAIGWVLPVLLARPVRAAPLAALVLLLVVRPLPTPGWPPEGWVLVMCDVGQGDGLVLNAGVGGAVVVDVGPEPARIDACLDRLEVRALRVVVLTHFHADHVAGLPAILEERPPAELLVTPLEEPAAAAAAVRSQAREAGVPVRVPRPDSTRHLGRLTWQVLGPTGRFASGAAGAEGSEANNASVTLLVETRGLRLLLPGDLEPEGQAALARTFPGLDVDVLKVPHHGSSHQDEALLGSLGARVALVPVGADNSYGHPSARILDQLEDAGATVRRTDMAGDVALVVDDDGQLTLRELSTSSSAMR